MTAEQMLYEFELSADQVSSKNAMNLPLAAKVSYLNRGQLSLILNRYGGNNLYKAGFEENRKRTEDLQALVVPNEDLTVMKHTERVYYADLIQTKQKFLILLGHKAYGSKNLCKGQHISTKEVQHDDLEEALSDPFRKPDFRWRAALLTTAQNKLWVHTDGFKIDKVAIDYLRYPRQIDVTGYINFDNRPSMDVKSELPDYLHNDIVAEAVLNLKADLGDPAYQTAAYKLQKIE